MRSACLDAAAVSGTVERAVAPRGAVGGSSPRVLAGKFTGANIGSTGAGVKLLAPAEREGRGPRSTPCF
jgi:hypothetical protein